MDNQLIKRFKIFPATLFSLLFFFGCGYSSATHAASSQIPISASLKGIEVAYFHVYESYPRVYKPYRGKYRGPGYYRYGRYWVTKTYYHRGTRCLKRCLIDSWAGVVIRCEKRCPY